MGFRKVLFIVATANFLYFGVEFFFARTSGSVSLFADSIDFLEDAFVNILILLGLGWSASSRGRLGKVLAFLILVPGLSTLWAAFLKISTSAPPNAGTMSWVGGGALLVNGLCALLLVVFRNEAGSLTKAAFFSARNDILANVAIIATAFITVGFRSFWPDLIVGLGIALMNADAARAVWVAAKKESLQAHP